MHRFWTTVIRPVLDLVEPATIVEIGAAGGAGTRLLAAYAAECRCTAHVIDPAPRFDPDEVGGRREAVVLHRDLSLNVLPRLAAVDVALLDGDHNWYTVFNELDLLYEAARRDGRLPPVVVAHDVSWPYGRRDLYYDPETIPAEFRRPWMRGGLVRGRDEPVAGHGLNRTLCNALEEGGPRNGVMTAIEDFVAAADEPIDVTVLPVLYGLGILVPRSRAQVQPRLSDELGRWRTADGWRRLAELAEAHRSERDAAVQALADRFAAVAAASDERDREDPRASPYNGRSFGSSIPRDVLASVQRGVLEGKYRGLRFLKSPFDVPLYLDLVDRLRPQTVVEIGTKEGGSALWLADTLRAHGIHGCVLSIDVASAPAVSDPMIKFLRGDARNLAQVLSEQVLASLARPLLVIEDSAHVFETTRAVLDFFHPHLAIGDYVVVEDGIVADLPGEQYRRYDNGPNRAVADFLNRHSGEYAIDVGLCDRYGYNATWSPNAWLRRI